MIRRLILSSIVAATLPVFILPEAVAELPVITLTSISPLGGQLGTEVDVTMTGTELEEANALFFSHPGITAKLGKPNVFSVKIAPDVPVGIYDLRVVGKLGVSNPRAFAVGDLKELTKAKPNDKQESAVELAPGTTFNGTATAAGSDFFKFTGKKGERMLVECSGFEMDSRINAVIAVLDSTGKEIESIRRGNLLDFTPQADGQFFIQLHDLTYAGGPEYGYRLGFSKGPHIDFIFPPCGQPSTKGRFTIYGRGLPGGTPANLTAFDRKPLEKLEVDVELPAAPGAPGNNSVTPASVTADGFLYRLKTPGGTSNPVFISFTPGPVTLEKEPNNTGAQAQKVSLPCEIAGQFYPAADNDFYTFDAKKGDNYWVEVFSNRTGVPASPFVVIQRDAPDPKDVKDIKEVYATEVDPGGKRFIAMNYDPAYRFEVKEDGAYRIQLRDLFGGARSNPAITYRLSIHKEAPDFRLAAMAELPSSKKDDTIAAPRGTLLRGGETVAVRVLAFRRDNFAGEIELSAEGLPSGVKSVPSKIEAGKNDGLLLLTADEKAPTAVAAIKIIGKGKNADVEIRREARTGATMWTVANINNDNVSSRLASEYVIAVSSTETAPISVQPAEDKVFEAAAGDKLDIPLSIIRRGEFAEALKLKAGGLAILDPIKEIDVEAKGTKATFSIDLKTVKLPAGTYSFYLSTQTKGKHAKKDATISLYSAPIRIAIK